MRWVNPRLLRRRIASGGRRWAQTAGTAAHCWGRLQPLLNPPQGKEKDCVLFFLRKRRRRGRNYNGQCTAVSYDDDGGVFDVDGHAGGGGGHHRRNDNDDGYRRGHHRGRYAAGGVGGGGVVGRAIEGVRRLRPAVSIVNVGKGHARGGSLVLTDAGTHM